MNSKSIIELRGAWYASVIAVGNSTNEAVGCLLAAIFGSDTADNVDQRGQEV